MSVLKADPAAGRVVGRRDGSFVVAEWTAPGGEPGFLAPPHAHLHDDEIWYVLDGVLRFRLGDEEVEAEAGAAVLGPAGIPHTFWNPAPEPARYLVVMTTGTIRLIEELHSSRQPPAELFERHGCAYLPDLWSAAPS